VRTLREDGDVLMPVDSSGRALELLMFLDSYWNTNKLTTYSIAFLTNVSYNVIEFAKSQLEWMSDNVMRAFDYSRENPFQFK
jgi:cleavage and polyadenylation specificity factor subunit 2